MTSLLSNPKQLADDNQYYINIGSLALKILTRTAEGSSNTGLVGGSFSTASWSLSAGAVTSSMLTAGGVILKDMGRTVVSSLRTFRKIQLVLPASASTFGVGGRSGTVAGSSGEDYFTGYIELGFEGNGTPAPVAKFGR
jgi:hypothetical protein